LKLKLFENVCNHEKESNTFKTFAKYANSKIEIFVNVYTSPHTLLLHDVIQKEDFRILKLLLDKGINIKPPHVDLF
jgi:hypothetical protein